MGPAYIACVLVMLAIAAQQITGSSAAASYPCNCLSTWQYKGLTYAGCAIAPGHEARPWCMVDKVACSSSNSTHKGWKYCKINKSPPAFFEAPAPVCPGPTDNTTTLAPEALNGSYMWAATQPGAVTIFCSVPTQCQLGMSLNVTVLSAPAGYTPRHFNITWAIPVNVVPYTPMTLLVGDMIIFTWAGFPHSVAAFPTPPSAPVCPGPTDTTAIVLAPEAMTGNYTWTASELGSVTVFCSVPTHCLSGMSLHITVMPAPAGYTPVKYTLAWRFTSNGAAYPAMTLHVGDSVTFTWNGFPHSVATFLSTLKPVPSPKPSPAPTPALAPTSYPPLVQICPGFTPVDPAGDTVLAPTAFTGQYTYKASTVGSYYIYCPVGTHCLQGMLVLINTASAPAGYTPQQYTITWTLPANSQPYPIMNVFVGDTILFTWSNFPHGVAGFPLP